MKKKELSGNDQSQGRQWHKAGPADKANGPDSPSPEVPLAYPCGMYDLGRNAGFVNVGTDSDPAAFLVASLDCWWRAEGSRLYPRARRLLISADGGDGNGWHLRLWEWELQRLADQTGLTLTVCHFFATHEQMEQGGSPVVFLPLVELARRTTARLRDGGAADRRDDDGQGLGSDLPFGPPQLPRRTQDHG
jgi:hypothetical protein